MISEQVFLISMLDLSSYNTLLLWTCFALCLSITVGGMLIIFRQGGIKELVALPYLQYFLILLYVFAYYSLWSQILLARFLEIENINRLIPIVAQMGGPFFIVSLLMQMIWVSKIQDKSPKLVVLTTLVIFLVVISAFLKWGWPVEDTVRAVYSLAGLIVELVVASVIIFGGKPIMQRKWRPYLIGSLIGASLIHLSYFSELSQGEFYEPVFVVLFFLFNTATVILYLYAANVEQKLLSFADFVAKYKISKRETDIIQGIYAGKTNQEIADSLFITLQTVKDHSSRIYQKACVKNRGQLTRLLRDSH